MIRSLIYNYFMNYIMYIMYYMLRKHEYSDANRLQAVIDYEIGIRLI